MSESVHPIEVIGLSRKFGKTQALDGVSLRVPKGIVMGLVGENGAGKTTLIKHLLGLLKPDAGTVRAFGIDPVQSPEQTLSRIGYLSENREIPGWMRISELIAYTRAFYPKWDDAYAAELLHAFKLDPTARVKNLSRGQRAQAALLIALAYRPELLLLDEPSSGLDPVVRRNILTTIIRGVVNEGRTVLLSSHLLDEVERMVDHVAMVHEGRIVLCATLDELQRQHRRVTVRLATSAKEPPQLPGVLLWDDIATMGDGREWTAICNGKTEEFRQAVTQLNAEIVEDNAATLEDIFVAHVRGGKKGA